MVIIITIILASQQFASGWQQPGFGPRHIYFFMTQASTVEEWAPDRRVGDQALLPGALPGAFSYLILLRTL